MKIFPVDWLTVLLACLAIIFLFIALIITTLYLSYRHRQRKKHNFGVGVKKFKNSSVTILFMSLKQRVIFHSASDKVYSFNDRVPK